MIKNAVLTPSNEDSGNGATITRLGHGLIVQDTGATQYWQIDTHTNQGFNLQLSLDDTWGFQSLYTTKIIIEIDSNDGCLISEASCGPKDLIIAFSQNGVDEYISLLTQILDENQYMYPKCEQTGTAQYATGNIKNIIDTENGFDRSYKMRQGAGITPLMYANHGQPTQFPFSFIFENDLSENYMRFSLVSNGQISTCRFVAMSPDIGFNVYIASEDIDDWALKVSSINVTRVYDQPTVSPTSLPTTDPSHNPSKSPSELPSNNPTKPPTENPTRLTGSTTVSLAEKY